MNSYYFSLILVVLSFSYSCYGNNDQIETPHNEITLSVGAAMQPYVLSKNRGIIVEILKEIFAYQGYHLNIRLEKNSNTVDSYNSKLVDGVAIAKAGLVKGYYSEPYITFHNVAVSLEKNHLEINRITDLSHKPIVAFDHATQYLGETYSEIMSHNVNYKEVVSQKKQVDMLFNERTKIIILEKTIFQFYWKQKRYQLNNQYAKQVTYHYIFPSIQYMTVFHQQKHQQLFNQAFAKLLANNTLEKIYQKYVKLLKNH